MEQNKFIFMTNTMRAGSSYLTRILSSHKQIALSYDSLNFFRYTFNRYENIHLEKNFQNLIKDTAFRLENRFGINVDTDICVKEASEHGFSYASAYWVLLKSIFNKQQSLYLGDKEAIAWSKIPVFLNMFPRGKVIITLRDPRDIVSSFKKITIAPENDYLIALFNVIDLVNHAKRFSNIYPDNVYIVQFEKLKMDTETEVKRLCEFLQLEFDNRMLDKENYTDHFGNTWDDKLSRSYPEEKDPLMPVGRWKKNILKEDLLLCEWLAQKQISFMGLQLSGEQFSQEEFDQALVKVTSSLLLREAFKNWSLLGEGCEKFPLDPIDPKNWERDNVLKPEKFKG
mgnify:CR=1 FL=1